MGRATESILKHRERVQRYLEEKHASVTSAPSFWVLLACVKSTMDPINACFEAMQGKDALVVQQNSRLEYLANTGRELVDIFTKSGMDLLLLVRSRALLA